MLGPLSQADTLSRRMEGSSGRRRVETKTVTRMEILEVVNGVFGGRSVDRAGILAAAVTGGARSQVIEALEGLPERRYLMMNELWEDLGHIPVG